MNHSSIISYAQRVKSNVAFTLAEVLITLGIIGVVAAMTIPTLLANSQKKDAFAALQKALSAISQISLQLRGENGGSMANLATTNLDFANLFQPYMKIAKFCQDDTDSENCYTKNTDVILNLQGSSYGSLVGANYYKDRPKLVTSDGFVYIFYWTNPNCDGASYVRGGVNEGCGVISVDINGTKSPNALGKDIFVTAVNKYNVTPVITSSGDCTLSNTDKWNGSNCAWKAIMEGGINYY